MKLLVLAFLFLFCLLASVYGAQDDVEDSDRFVTVNGTSFEIGGKPYRFVGVNMWYGAYLGAKADYGDRARLIKELDLLAEIGVTNLRVLGASEESPGDNAIYPVFQKKDGSYNEDLFVGLDFLLAEMSKRDMRAVIYLNNFWEWSGGMGVYRYWETGQYIDLTDPAHPWPAYPRATAQFYSDKAANARYQKYIKYILRRTNSITGKAYANDPSIMSWQLANEPRPGSDDEFGRKNLENYYRWTRETAVLIKDLAPRQLVSIGNEGLVGSIHDEACFIKSHRPAVIDYLTFHMWPKNWQWIDSKRMKETYPDVEKKALNYVSRHTEFATRLNKPIVLEEFGLERDQGSFAPDSTTTYRDRFYRLVFRQVEQNRAEGGPFVGTNLWSWGGLGKAKHGDFKWRNGDRSYVGDPPQEPQGLNSVYAADASTLKVIRDHARKLESK